MAAINSVSRPVFVNETSLNVTTGGIPLSPSDIILIKAAFLQQISFVAWLCLFIGFTFGLIAGYIYCKRQYGIL